MFSMATIFVQILYHLKLLAQFLPLKVMLNVNRVASVTEGGKTKLLRNWKFSESGRQNSEGTKNRKKPAWSKEEKKNCVKIKRHLVAFIFMFLSFYEVM